MKPYPDFIRQLMEKKESSKGSEADEAEADDEQHDDNAPPKKKFDNVKKRTRRPIKFNRGEDDGQSLSPMQYQ